MNFCGASLDLFGQPVRAHLLIPSPMLAHLQNLSILSSWGWMCVIFEDMRTRSSAQAAELIVLFKVLKLYP